MHTLSVTYKGFSWPSWVNGDDLGRVLRGNLKTGSGVKVFPPIMQTGNKFLALLHLLGQHQRVAS